jgi:outer membrane protein
MSKKASHPLARVQASSQNHFQPIERAPFCPEGGETVNSMNLIRIAAMIVMCGLHTDVLLAQGKSTTSEPATKVGAINVRQAIVSTAEGKQASAQLDSEFSARRKELEGLSGQINDIQQRLAAGANTLSEGEKARLTLQGQRLAQQLDRKQNEFTEDLNNAQSDVIGRISLKLSEVVKHYAPNNGYSVVLDNSAQNTPVLYAATDITQDIVSLYDETYPLKSSAAPGGSKPESKPTAKPSGR